MKVATFSTVTLCLFLVLTLGITDGAEAQRSGRQAQQISEARSYLDQGRADEALPILDRVLSKGKPSAEALFLRSTGRIMVGEVEAGITDLHQALELDPSIRQGWLNLAGLEIAQRRFDSAYDALVQAQKLDPSAPDNDLNLGAVLVMRGRVEPASEHFRRYLAQQNQSADAHYLVAGNYALANVQDRAIAHFEQAIAKDERYRLRARTDERFIHLDDPAFQRLLRSDGYQPPEGYHRAATAFHTPYDTKDNKLLYAVLEALKNEGVTYDPAVEATPRWALVFGDIRVKVANQADGTGIVSLSAAPDRYTEDSWQTASQGLFRAIHGLLTP